MSDCHLRTAAAVLLTIRVSIKYKKGPNTFYYFCTITQLDLKFIFIVMKMIYLYAVLTAPF